MNPIKRIPNKVTDDPITKRSSKSKDGRLKSCKNPFSTNVVDVPIKVIMPPISWHMKAELAVWKVLCCVSYPNQLHKVSLEPQPEYY